MGSLTDFSENELLDHVCNAAYVPPTNIYLALCTADPTDAAAGNSMNEVPDNFAYARTAITFGAAAARRVTQDADVVFPQATGSWGTITHWAITDSAVYGAGNVLAHGAFTVPKTMINGNTPKVAAAQLWVEFSAGGISDYLANALLDLMFNNVAYAKPDTFVGLATTTVTDDDTGATLVEPVGGSYARVQVNPNGGSSPTWDLAVDGLVDNTHAVTFPTATGDWGTLVTMVVCDAAEVGAGNLLFYDNDNFDDQAVGNGDTAEFGVGELDLTMS